ncbi:MAG: hypothetical protein AAFX95_28130 [Cyanobacteria bacterium J06639_16]
MRASQGRKLEATEQRQQTPARGQGNPPQPGAIAAGIRAEQHAL